MKPTILVASAFALGFTGAGVYGCALGRGVDATVPAEAGCDEGGCAPPPVFPDAAPPCVSTCSDDLTSVVDCVGNVISTCPAGLACSADLSCAEPCTATESLKSSTGCHYAVPPPTQYDEDVGECFVAFVANAWTDPVKLDVSYGTRKFDLASIARLPTGLGTVTLAPFPADGMLPPGQLAVLFLADRPGSAVSCPTGVQPAVTDVDTSMTNSGVGQVFSITSSGPIVAFDMFPYGGAASYVTAASLLLPTSAWAETYTAVHAFHNDNTLGLNGTYLQIMANVDTTLTLWPSSDIPDDGGIQGGLKHQPYTSKLSAGQFLQINGPDLTGTPIAATAPIGVVGGNTCMRIPIGVPACDSGHQQLLPVNSLGSLYVGARHRDRVTGANESVPYRIMGVVDGTELTFDPPIPNAPTSVGKGQLATTDGSGAFWTSKDFVVRSQDAAHPFYMSAHMSGANTLGSADGGINNEGDPDFVNVVTPAQFLRSYVFLTDPTYANTHLVIVRRKTSGGTFEDVTLKCAGTIGGWQPVDAAGEFQVAKVDLVADGKAVGACGNGVQRASSKAPFSITVWGWDVYVSYAYPAGTFIQKTNTVDITQN